MIDFVKEDLDDHVGESKSAVKRAMHQRRKMVVELLELPPKIFQKIAADEDLLAEFTAARNMQRAALKRQIGFITKQLDDVSADQLQDQLNILQDAKAQNNKYFHQLERWRDDLLSGDQTLTEQLVETHQADRQKLRQLVRMARKEQQLEQNSADNKTQAPTKARKQLFQFLKEMQKDSV